MFMRGGKVNVADYWWNIVTKLKVNKWSIFKQLSNKKPKILMVYQEKDFVDETETHCIDDEGKVQPVTDTDNEFTEC